MIKNVLISGGTGLIGSIITEEAESKGYNIAYLSRTAGEYKGYKKYKWDIRNQEIDKSSLEWADAIMHLAGAGVADKNWSTNRKKEILNSRTDSTDLLFNTIKEGDYGIQKVISASAIGYYGFGDKNHPFSEDSPPADDFLAKVCQQWEASTSKFSNLNIQNTRIRIGIVLSSKGGALKKIMQPVKFGLGAPLGSGNQVMSWIHIEDLTGLFTYFLENDQEGIYNGVAPNPISNAYLTKVVANKLGRPLFLPNIPSFVLKFALGEMSEIVLNGSNVSSKKVESLGFKFKFTDISEAIKDIVHRGV